MDLIPASDYTMISKDEHTCYWRYGVKLRPRPPPRPPEAAQLHGQLHWLTADTLHWYHNGRARETSHNSLSPLNNFTIDMCAVVIRLSSGFHSVGNCTVFVVDMVWRRKFCGCCRIGSWGTGSRGLELNVTTVGSKLNWPTGGAICFMLGWKDPNRNVESFLPRTRERANESGFSLTNHMVIGTAGWLTGSYVDPRGFRGICIITNVPGVVLRLGGWKEKEHLFECPPPIKSWEKDTVWCLA